MNHLSFTQNVTLSTPMIFKHEFSNDPASQLLQLPFQEIHKYQGDD